MIKTRLSLLVRRTMYADGVTILPAKVMTSIFFIMLFNSMTITTPFAFIPKLVKSFGTSEVDTGYKVGMIACALFVGRIGFSFVWGYLCDKYGSKKTAVLSAFCLATSILAFSFSFNFPWTVAARFFQGVSMGLDIISKKVLAEHTDETNYSLGMCILIGTFSFGVIIGPSLGGFLAFPDELYSQVFSKDSIFAKFPVLLPCGIIAISFYFVVVLFWFWVPSQESTEKCEPFQTKENKIKLLKNSEDLDLPSNAIKDLPEDEIQTTDYDCSINTSKAASKSSSKFHFGNTTVGRLLRNKTCLNACLLYTLSITLGMSFDEAFPLFAATTKEYGGFSFTTVDIGISLMVVAIITLVLQFTLFSRIIDKFGARKTYFFSNMAMASLYPLVPLSHYIHDRRVFWTVMLCASTIIHLCIALSAITTNIFVNNSVSLNLLGSAMGAAITSSNIGRAIGVTSTGIVYGWSLTNVKNVVDNKNPLGFPLDQFFVFFVFSAFAIVNGVCIFIMPQSIDKPFIEKLSSNIANNEQ